MKKLWPIIFLAGLVCGCASPIKYSFETQKDPPNRIWIAEVNLADPHVQVRVAQGGPDPDGPGKWQTTLLEPTKIARREGFELVVNGDFFDAHLVKDAEGVMSKYRADVWASAVGPAMTDGKAWSVSEKPRPCLIVHADKKVTIDPVAKPDADDWEVISGNIMLVTNGAVVPQKNKAKHPRTAVGLDATGKKLTIVVVDGRKAGIAAGMDYEELAAEMVKLGCRRALNLDGGGSSVMARREENGDYKILNAPTDGHERAVANALGITLTK